MTSLPFLTHQANLCALGNNSCRAAVISIGNSLRQDDGVAKKVFDKLPAKLRQNLCHFDLGCYTNHLIDCLSGHEAAVIIDSTQSGSAAGSTMVIDLNEAINKHENVLVNSCHGFSLFDELRLAAGQKKLPSQLYFFGIEANSTDWTEGLSPLLASKILGITTELQSLIEALPLQRQVHA